MKKKYEKSKMDKMHDKMSGAKEGSKKEEAMDKMRKHRRPKLGSGGRFKQLKSKLALKGVKNPGALAAYIGRKKYGNKKFAQLSVQGKRKQVKKRVSQKQLQLAETAIANPNLHKRASSPFSNLGRDDQQVGTRINSLQNQGRRLTGKELLKKAMGRLVRKK